LLLVAPIKAGQDHLSSLEKLLASIEALKTSSSTR